MSFDKRYKIDDPATNRAIRAMVSQQDAGKKLSVINTPKSKDAIQLRRMAAASLAGNDFRKIKKSNDPATDKQLRHMVADQ